MRNLGKSCSCLACQPGRRVAVATDEDEDKAVEGPLSQKRALVAELMNRPKFLHQLWKEWLVSAVGKKAAKDFTTAERSKEKSKFSWLASSSKQATQRMSPVTGYTGIMDRV